MIWLKMGIVWGFVFVAVWALFHRADEGDESDGEIAASMLDPEEVTRGEERLRRGEGVPIEEAVRKLRATDQGDESDE